MEIEMQDAKKSHSTKTITETIELDTMNIFCIRRNVYVSI
jgi:hypothetical protein